MKSISVCVLACIYAGFALLAGFCGGRMWGLDGGRGGARYGHQTWQTGSGLPQNTVHAILQTRDGFLWIATEGGLLRFDGISFVLYDMRTVGAMRSDLVSSLAEAPDGALLAGTGAGLLEARGGRFRLLATGSQTSSGGVRAIRCNGENCWVFSGEEVAIYHKGGMGEGVALSLVSAGGNVVDALDRDGSIWVGAAGGVVRVRKGAGDKAVISQKVNFASAVTALTEGADGVLWVGTRNGLMRLDPGAQMPEAVGTGFEVSALAESAGGVVYAGTNRGVGRIEGGRLEWVRRAQGLPDERVDSVFVDREGAAWVDTEAGLARVAQGRVEALPAGLAIGGPVLSWMEDREGDLWVGTDASGLTVLRDQAFATLTVADGLAANGLRSVYAGADGTVWMGTDGAGLSRWRGALRDGRFEPALTAGEGLPSDTVLALAGQADGTVWAGTPDGLARIGRDGKVTVLTAADGLPDDFIRSVRAGREGGLWIGTRHGLAHRTGDGRIAVFTKADGLGSDIVGALWPDAGERGAVWAGTLSGLSHVDGRGRITNLTRRDGLGSDVVTALYQDAGGAVWVGTQSGGLARLKDGRVAQFPGAKTGLPEAISSIVEDAEGYLWLGSEGGIYRVKRAELEGYAAGSAAPLHVAGYGVGDGMAVAACATGHPAATRGRDGSLWFATLKGVSVTDPAADRTDTVAPPVVIEEAEVDGAAVPLHGRLQVRPGQTRLTFQYAGLSFAAPGKVRYRYKLEGFDKGWTDAGGRRTADYTNLSPGRYRFRVLAANGDGVWNEKGAAFAFRVMPHYYETWWFAVLALAGAGGLVYAGYRLRLRVVESRFQAVLGERNRIAREIHDTLAQDIVGIGVQLELASRLMGAAGEESREAARAQLEQARGLVKTSLAEARSSIWRLRSEVSQEELPDRLAKLGRGVGPEGPKVVVKVHGARRELARTTEDELVKIASEAVTNAVRHAEARRVEVVLEYGAGVVELAVADDGRGFVESGSLVREGHFGLKGMRERAAGIGGELRVESRVGAGTRVWVRVGMG